MSVWELDLTRALALAPAERGRRDLPFSLPEEVRGRGAVRIVAGRAGLRRHVASGDLAMPGDVVAGEAEGRFGRRQRDPGPRLGDGERVGVEAAFGRRGMNRLAPLQQLLVARDAAGGGDVDEPGMLSALIGRGWLGCHSDGRKNHHATHNRHGRSRALPAQPFPRRTRIGCRGRFQKMCTPVESRCLRPAPPETGGPA